MLKTKENREKSKFLKGKKDRGITLVALVVTIIILLILAGISIGMLTGDNSIIAQARKCERTIGNFKRKGNSRNCNSASYGKKQIWRCGKKRIR